METQLDDYTLKAEKKWTRMIDNWDLCLSQFRIMYEGRI